MSVNLDIERSADEIEDSHETELDTLNDKEPEFVGDADSSDESQEEEPAEREEVGANFSSVQQYLHEIGSVALLSRERETQLAMQMERGKNQILQALWSMPDGVASRARTGKCGCKRGTGSTHGDRQSGWRHG